MPLSTSQTNIYAPGSPDHESNQIIRLGSDHNTEFHRLCIAFNYFMENDPKKPHSSFPCETLFRLSRGHFEVESFHNQCA